jgi:long-chain acyl-CoA synthetase
MTDAPKLYPTVVHMLDEASQQSSQSTAVIHEGRQLTYSEYLRCVAGLSRKLQSFSADQSLRGQRVALICGNSLEMAVGLFAAHASGAQIVPINPIYTARELLHILSDAEPMIVIYDISIDEIVQPLFEKLSIHHSIGVGGATGEFFDVWRDDIEISLPEMPDPDDFATLQYTGGTTGLPKGVDITHRQLATNISQRESRWPTREGVEKVLCVMPLFHVYASSMALHLTAYCKGCLNILTRYKPDVVLDTIVNERITLLPIGPSVFHGLMAYEKFTETNFSSLKVAYSGSAPLPEETLRRWEEATGCPILEGYGQSEAGPVVSAVAQGAVMLAGSVGQPLVDTVVQIVDVKSGTEVLGVGKKGEIRLKGPQVMSGYRNRPTETEETLRDGWLYTGDIGEIDSGGNLFIRDRKKDMVIVGGYNVYPREVDEVLYSHPDISEVAAVGVPDEYRGEVIQACVSLRDGSIITSGDLMRFCDQELAKYKVPVKIKIWKEIPKTTVGKIDKAAVRDLLISLA